MAILGFADDELQALSSGIQFHVPITEEHGMFYGELDCMQLVVPGESIEEVRYRLTESILAVIMLRSEKAEPFLWPQAPPNSPTAVEVATITIRYRPSATSDEEVK